MKKQWRVLFLAAAAAAVMSTGCGNSASTQTTAATTAAETTSAETTAAESKAEESEAALSMWKVTGVPHLTGLR